MTEQTDLDRIYEDSRAIVRGQRGVTTEAKRTVAMNCIRELERNPHNAAAFLPMMMEKYFEESPGAAVARHASECAALRRPFSTVLAGAGGGGVMGLVFVVVRWAIWQLTEGGA